MNAFIAPESVMPMSLKISSACLFSRSQLLLLLSLSCLYPSFVFGTNTIIPQSPRVVLLITQWPRSEGRHPVRATGLPWRGRRGDRIWPRQGDGRRRQRQEPRPRVPRDAEGQEAPRRRRGDLLEIRLLEMAAALTGEFSLRSTRTAGFLL